MAATVEGLFKIIDGASGPMKKMERQALKTDAAIEGLGKRLDDVGSDKQLKQMGDVDRNIKTIDRDARTFSGGSGGGGRLRSTLKGAGDDSDRLSTKLGRVGISLASIGKIFAAMKLPLMVSGVVALVQGVSALAGGAAALIPKLTDLAGVAGALPIAFTGIAIAVGAAKLAFSGIGRALKGTKGAMAELTPQAREFVRVLREMKPITNSLKASAQESLFPGLTNALSQLKTGVPTAKKLLSRGGSVLGGIAERASSAVTGQGFLKDLTSVGQSGLTVVNRMGSGLINIVEALRHLAVAAEPFTNWLSQTILGWTEWAKHAAEAGRRTGDLRAYFERTRSALETFGSIAKNIWEVLKGIGKAARPLGEDLWESADKATEKWAKFANSLEGQQTLRVYFEGLKTNIEAIFNFVGKVGGAFSRLGTGQGFAKTMESLTRALEPLEHLFSVIGEKFGPALAKTLEQLVVLFDNLGGGSSVLINVIELFNMFLEGVNKLLEKVPGLTNLITAVLGVFALRSLAGRISGVASSWGLVATEATAAAEAQAAAAGTGVVSGGGFFGRRGRAAAPTTVKGDMFGIAGAAGRAAPKTGGILGGIKGAIGGAGVMGAAGMGLRAAGKFLWPIAAFMGATDFLTTPGDIGEKLQGTASGFTMGLIPGPVSDQQRRSDAVVDEQRKIKEMLGETPRSRKGLLGTVHNMRRRVKNLAGDQGVETKTIKGVTQTFDTHNDIGDNERQKELRKTIAGLNKEIAAQSRSAGSEAVDQFGKAWSIRVKAGGLHQAAQATFQPLLKEIGPELGNKGSKELAGAALKWYQAAAQKNPKLRGVYEELVHSIEGKFTRMGEHIKVVNGQIYTGSQEEWKKISAAMTGPAEEAAEEVRASFTKLQEDAVGALRAMGYSPSQAKNIIQSKESGHPTKASTAENVSAHQHGGAGATPNNIQMQGPNHAYGGRRLKGFGNQDNIPMAGGGMAANGELVVNRHTEARANAVLGMYGTSLGGMVGKEGVPHSELTYARGGRRPSVGGMAGVKTFAEGMGLHAGEGPGEATPGVHVPDSLHYQGLAWDVSGAPNLMMAFRKASEQKYLGHGLNELFYDPYSYYIDNGTKVPGAIGGHSDHVHIGFFPGGPSGSGPVRGLMGAAMAGGKGAARLINAPRSKHGGAPGALANAGMGAIAAGFNKKIQGAAGMGATGALGRIGASLKGGSRSAVESQIAAVLFAGGLNKVGAAGIIGNAYAESSMNPTADDGANNGGLWGFTASPNSYDDMKNWTAQHGLNWQSASAQTKFLLSLASVQSLIPQLNASGSAEAAAALFMSDFERPGIPRLDVRQAGAATAFSHGYSKGGRAPNFAGWFGSGGTVTANGPTLMGIGESGSEVATVRPKGRGTAGAGGGIRVGSIHIENHRPGDIRRQVKAEFGAAMDELASELELGPEIDDSEVL